MLFSITERHCRANITTKTFPSHIITCRFVLYTHWCMQLDIVDHDFNIFQVFIFNCMPFDGKDEATVLSQLSHTESPKRIQYSMHQLFHQPPLKKWEISTAKGRSFCSCLDVLRWNGLFWRHRDSYVIESKALVNDLIMGTRYIL